MRVLMLTSSYPCRDGDWRGGFVRDLGRALMREGLDVTVAVPRPPEPFVPPPERDGDPPCLWLPSWLGPRARGFHGFGLETDLTRDPSAWLNLPPLLLAFAAEALPHALLSDVVVAHWLFPMGAVGALLARVTSRPIGIVAHSGPPGFARIPPLSLAARAVVGRASGVACVSESVRNEVQSVAGRKGRVEVLPLGVDLRASAEPQPLQDRPARFLFVGRLVPLKGADLIVRAARCLQGMAGAGEVGALVEWTLVGDGPEAARLRDMAPQCVTFLGEVAAETVRRQMGVHDALIVPSRVGSRGRCEGLPRVLLEAWSCGLPVLAADTGGLGDAVRRHGGGLLFPVDSEEALVTTIRTFLADAGLRARLRREALDAASCYAWERVGPRWAEWVRGLAASARDSWTAPPGHGRGRDVPRHGFRYG